MLRSENVKTPNLDKVAAQNERYTEVFYLHGLYKSSAFFVGMYQTTTDTHNMRSHREDDYRLPDGVRPITHRLKDRGYFAANLKTMNGEEIGSGNGLNFVNEGKLYDGSKWEVKK